jgi:hypothetical protein
VELSQPEVGHRVTFLFYTLCDEGFWWNVSEIFTVLCLSYLVTRA